MWKRTRRTRRRGLSGEADQRLDRCAAEQRERLPSDADRPGAAEEERGDEPPQRHSTGIAPADDRHRDRQEADLLEAEYRGRRAARAEAAQDAAA